MVLYILFFVNTKKFSIIRIIGCLYLDGIENCVTNQVSFLTYCSKV